MPSMSSMLSSLLKVIFLKTESLNFFSSVLICFFLCSDLIISSFVKSEVGISVIVSSKPSKKGLVFLSPFNRCSDKKAPKLKSILGAALSDDTSAPATPSLSFFGSFIFSSITSASIASLDFKNKSKSSSLTKTCLPFFSLYFGILFYFKLSIWCPNFNIFFIWHICCRAC